MKNFFKGVVSIIAIVLFIDMLCFGAWIMSGQQPIGKVYFGMITGNVLKAVLVEEKTPCSYPDPQFSGAEDADYHCGEFDSIQGGEIK